MLLKKKTKPSVIDLSKTTKQYSRIQKNLFKEFYCRLYDCKHTLWWEGGRKDVLNNLHVLPKLLVFCTFDPKHN